MLSLVAEEQSATWVSMTSILTMTMYVLLVLICLVCSSIRTSHNRAWLVASVCSYGGVQGAGNRDYCAVAIQGVSKWNPCWPGWWPAGGHGQCVYACHRALESSMAPTDTSDY